MAREIADPVHLTPPRSAYIHVPFCHHRCGYCDFTLVAGRDRLIPEYLSALEIELSSLEETTELETLYFGGGTPTHLSPDQLRHLFALVSAKFTLATNAEFTVEANPVDLSEDRIDALVEAGVNRISLGVQSFDKLMLATLERDHSEETVRDALVRLGGRIDNVSLDLIFGVPGQSFELWQETLDRAIELKPAHLSTYGLTFEKGTEFWNRREKGNLDPISDELERAMYALTIERLTAAGYEHYEVSSFAKPGFRSRHNQVYWSGRAYHAFGPGASRYLNGVRSTNHRSVTKWLERLHSSQSGIAESEELSAEDRARERLILGLRRIDGVDADQFVRETGFTFDELAKSEIERATRQGLLEREAGRLRLTAEGRFFADSVIVELL